MQRRDLKPNPWLAYTQPNPRAQLRLFCFPYAGGSAGIYRKWASDAPPGVEICPVQLPGRESRLMETPYKSMSDLVEATLAGLAQELVGPFAFLGHSMGAVLSFELTRRLRQQGGPLPVHLFVSGCRAPHTISVRRPIYHLPDDEFIAGLRRLNGTPEAVLQNPELMQLVLPALRADFSAIEQYTYRAEEPLDSPITAFHGLDDIDVPTEHVEAWRELTGGRFARHSFAGDHFFIHHVKDAMLRQVALNVG
ncbi:MAG TPA: alpha/beta fold hydrolase [Symbiobacteriaceae bacterium]|nr:alpha/beta fold hydrolase [Symbiobacteriaceae bacterium]